jgi:RNA polymerase sigma factor (sigma-70 family)
MANGFKYDVFLSHSSKDKAVVRPVAERLRRDGLTVWFDEWVLNAGDNIPAKIEEGLEHSRMLVLCMSVNAFGSDWAQLEAGTFRFRDPLNRERRFIPLRLDDAPIKGSLAQFLYINWQQKDEGQYRKLLTMCRAKDDGKTPTERKGKLDKYPYSAFSDSFRDVVAPIIYGRSSAIMNIVFGDLADIRETVVVLPVNQAYDLEQRGPASVLASFEDIRVGQTRFFDAIDKAWPRSRRPRNAAIGDCHLIALKENSQRIPAVLFAVTTRNLSPSPQHYGRYVNTPVAGIDYIVESLINAANESGIASLGLPLLGAGYANIGRTSGKSDAREKLRSIVLCMLLAQFEAVLTSAVSSLKRVIIVIHSKSPNSPEEHVLWEQSIQFLKLSAKDREGELHRLLRELEAKTEQTKHNKLQEERSTTADSAKTRIELKIDGEFDSFSSADQSRLFSAIKQLLRISGDLRITDKRRGSVYLTLELDRDKAGELAEAVNAGRLSQFGVVSARLEPPEMSNLRAGNSQAFEDVYKKFSKPVLLRIQQLLRGSLGYAEDMVLETFLRFWRMVTEDHLPGQVITEHELSRLLMVIASRLAIDMSSRRRRRVADDDVADTPILVADTPHAAAETRELAEQITEIVSSLPERQRAVVQLTLEGLSFQEIAAQLGCSVNTVYTSLFRAKAAIRKRLSADP